LELTDRKLKILQAIIRNYLETGEPVGSRTISKYTDLNLSSATIRNEMSDLEEMGYIVQPHTSAGRIPSDKGYRLYVDMLMKEKADEMASLKVELDNKTAKLEVILKETAKILAHNTNYASLVTTPQYRTKKLKFLQLSKMDEHNLLAIVVLEGNVIQNRVVATEGPVEEDTILKLNLILNTYLNGLDLREINLGVISKMKQENPKFATLLTEVLDSIADCFGEENIETFTSGATNIFKYPELNDSQKASNLLYALEEKKQLTELMYSEGDSDRGIQVYIGDESPLEATKDCAVVTATYHLDEGVYGKIGIIGPRRMDYEKVVSSLQNLMSELDEIMK